MREPGSPDALGALLRQHGTATRADLSEIDLRARVLDELARPDAVANPPRHHRRRAAATLGAIAVGLTSAAWVLDTMVFDAGPITVHDGPAPDRPLAGDLHLGQPITGTQARSLELYVAPTVGWLAGPPLAWSDDEVPEQLSLTYPAGPELPGIAGSDVGVLIQTFAGDGREAIRKYLTTSARATRLEVDGEDAVFISGGDHVLFYLRADGTYATAPGRSLGNAMILQRGGLTIRIEADLPLDRMLELATSLA